MSLALITLFAVSILGALGMAVYGLRVLVGRWEQPRRLRQQAMLPVPGPALVTPVRPVPVPAPVPVQAMPPAQPAPPTPVWIAPMGTPAPMAAPFGVATPPPLRLPSAGPASFTPPPATGFAAASAPTQQMMVPPARPPSASFVPAPAWSPPPRTPSPRAPSPGQVSGIVSYEAPRLARGSIPPDFSSADEPDTDPGIPELVEPEPVVTRGARYSVIRSSRR